jgi:drug/metabolite transporter (DMT)-like permease
MYRFILGVALLKSLNPYFRKHLLTTLNTHDLLFINTFLIFIVVFVFFAYKCIIEGPKSIQETFKNYNKLSNTQFLSLLVMAFFAVCSSMFLYDLDKNYNTPLLNNIFLRIASIFAVIFVGIFIFEEKYSWKQFLGIFITFFGVYLLTE